MTNQADNSKRAELLAAITDSSVMNAIVTMDNAKAAEYGRPGFVANHKVDAIADAIIVGGSRNYYHAEAILAKVRRIAKKLVDSGKLTAAKRRHFVSQPGDGPFGSMRGGAGSCKREYFEFKRNVVEQADAAKADAPVAEAAKADAPKLSKFRYTKAADHAPDDSIETNWCSYDVTAILTDGSEIEIGNVHSCTDRWRTGWGHVNTTFAESTRHEAAQDLWRRYMQKQADAAKADAPVAEAAKADAPKPEQKKQAEPTLYDILAKASASGRNSFTTMTATDDEIGVLDWEVCEEHSDTVATVWVGRAIVNGKKTIAHVAMVTAPHIDYAGKFRVVHPMQDNESFAPQGALIYASAEVAAGAAAVIRRTLKGTWSAKAEQYVTVDDVDVITPVKNPVEPMTDELRLKMRTYNDDERTGGVGRVPAEYVDYHRRIAEADIDRRFDSGEFYDIQAQRMVDDGWCDGMQVVEIDVVTYKHDGVKTLRWNDSLAWFERKPSGGGARTEFECARPDYEPLPEREYTDGDYVVDLASYARPADAAKALHKALVEMAKRCRMNPAIEVRLLDPETNGQRGYGANWRVCFEACPVPEWGVTLCGWGRIDAVGVTVKYDMASDVPQWYGEPYYGCDLGFIA